MPRRSMSDSLSSRPYAREPMTHWKITRSNRFAAPAAAGRCRRSLLLCTWRASSTHSSLSDFFDAIGKPNSIGVARDHWAISRRRRPHREDAACDRSGRRTSSQRHDLRADREDQVGMIMNSLTHTRILLFPIGLTIRALASSLPAAGFACYRWQECQKDDGRKMGCVQKYFCLAYFCQVLRLRSPCC